MTMREYWLLTVIAFSAIGFSILFLKPDLLPHQHIDDKIKTKALEMIIENKAYDMAMKMIDDAE